MNIKKPDEQKLYGRIAKFATEHQGSPKSKLMNAALIMTSSVLISGCETKEERDQFLIKLEQSANYKPIPLPDNSPSDDVTNGGSVC